MSKVTKRDGRPADFELAKTKKAIRPGMTSVPVLFADGKRYNGLGHAPGWLDARKDP